MGSYWRYNAYKTLHQDSTCSAVFYSEHCPWVHLYNKYYMITNGCSLYYRGTVPAWPPSPSTKRLFSLPVHFCLGHRRFSHLWSTPSLLQCHISARDEPGTESSEIIFDIHTLIFAHLPHLLFAPHHGTFTVSAVLNSSCQPLHPTSSISVSVSLRPVFFSVPLFRFPMATISSGAKVIKKFGAWIGAQLKISCSKIRKLRSGDYKQVGVRFLCSV